MDRGIDVGGRREEGGSGQVLLLLIKHLSNKQMQTGQDNEGGLHQSTFFSTTLADSKLRLFRTLKHMPRT